MIELTLSLEDLTPVGEELTRPECVLCTKAGHLYSADWRGGVAHVLPDGTQQLITPDALDGPPLKPNGIALMRDGSFLIADLGERAGVWRLTRDGVLESFLHEVDGETIPPSNFVLVDTRDRVWITVSTRHEPRATAYRHDVADGYVALVDANGARIVADGLGYTNEVRLDADESHLYVNETFGRRLTRFAVAHDGSLSDKTTVAEFGAGTFPDGVALDQDGGAWVTSIVSNRIIYVAPDGEQRVILEDSDEARLAEVEEAFQANTMGRPHLDTVKSRMLGHVSSLAFGGPDLRTAYLGCLLDSKLWTFRAPVAGLPPAHWEWG